MDDDPVDVMHAELAGAADDDLELLGLVKMRADDGAGFFLHQERHRVQRVQQRCGIARLMRKAVGADE